MFSDNLSVNSFSGESGEVRPENRFGKSTPGISTPARCLRIPILDCIAYCSLRSCKLLISSNFSLQEISLLVIFIFTAFYIAQLGSWVTIGFFNGGGGGGLRGWGV
jgi:hypothetical protein